MKTIIVFFYAIIFITIPIVISCSLHTGDVPSEKKLKQVNLKPSKYNSSGYGRATFVAITGEKSEVDIQITNIPLGIERPVHIYTYIFQGSCAMQGGKIEYELNDTILMSRVGHDIWRTIKIIPVDLPTLLSGNYSIIIRSSPPDGYRDLFCGDVH